MRYLYRDIPKLARRHINPDGSEGGWVSDTAHVDPTCFIGRDACVYDEAQVLDFARIEDEAKICGNARISGNAKVSSYAYVGGFAQVGEDAIVTGASMVANRVNIFGKFIVTGYSCLYGVCEFRGVGSIYGEHYDVNYSHLDTTLVQKFFKDREDFERINNERRHYEYNERQTRIGE